MDFSNVMDENTYMLFLILININKNVLRDYYELIRIPLSNRKSYANNVKRRISEVIEENKYRFIYEINSEIYPFNNFCYSINTFYLTISNEDTLLILNPISNLLYWKKPKVKKTLYVNFTPSNTLNGEKMEVTNEYNHIDKLIIFFSGLSDKVELESDKYVKFWLDDDREKLEDNILIRC